MFSKFCALIVCILFFVACAQQKQPPASEAITDTVLPDSLFSKLIDLTTHSIPEGKLQDSLAFLVLPAEVSCPACRDKTIDSIDKYRSMLDDAHFVIISAKGHRAIDAYFKERSKAAPVAKDGIFLDTTDQAYFNDIATSNPAIYYTYKGKIYQKVNCLPETIKEDLKKFFSQL